MNTATLVAVKLAAPKFAVAEELATLAEQLELPTELVATARKAVVDQLIKVKVVLIHQRQLHQGFQTLIHCCLIQNSQLIQISWQAWKLIQEMELGLVLEPKQEPIMGLMEPKRVLLEPKLGQLELQVMLKLEVLLVHLTLLELL